MKSPGALIVQWEAQKTFEVAHSAHFAAGFSELSTWAIEYWAWAVVQDWGREGTSKGERVGYVLEDLSDELEIIRDYCAVRPCDATLTERQKYRSLKKYIDITVHMLLPCRLLLCMWESSLGAFK